MKSIDSNEITCFHGILTKKSEKNEIHQLKVSAANSVKLTFSFTFLPYIDFTKYIDFAYPFTKHKP